MPWPARCHASSCATPSADPSLSRTLTCHRRGRRRCRSGVHARGDPGSRTSEPRKSARMPCAEDWVVRALRHAAWADRRCAHQGATRRCDAGAGLGRRRPTRVRFKRQQEAYRRTWPPLPWSVTQAQQFTSRTDASIIASRERPLWVAVLALGAVDVESGRPFGVTLWYSVIGSPSAVREMTLNSDRRRNVRTRKGRQPRTCPSAVRAPLSEGGLAAIRWPCVSAGRQHLGRARPCPNRRLREALVR